MKLAYFEDLDWEDLDLFVKEEVEPLKDFEFAEAILELQDEIGTFHNQYHDQYLEIHGITDRKIETDDMPDLIYWDI